MEAQIELLAHSRWLNGGVDRSWSTQAAIQTTSHQQQPTTSIISEKEVEEYVEVLEISIERNNI